MRVLVIIIICLFSMPVFSQNYSDSLAVISDSNIRTNSHITAVNLVSNGKLIRGIEAIEYGIEINGLREGLWDVFNKDSVIIAHRFYKNDIVISEVQYRKSGKVSAIIVTKVTTPYNSVSRLGISTITEIVVYNWRGRVKKKLMFDLNGEITEIVY